MATESDSTSPRPPSKPSIDPEQWMTEHGDYLFAYALGRVRDKTVAEDLVQETFLSGLRGISGFRGSSSLRTWLVSILKHKILDYYRDRYRRGVDASSADEEDETSFRREGDWRGHWEPRNAPRQWPVTEQTAVEEAELRQILDECVSKLPQRLRLVFTMREIDEMGTVEICKVLDISTTNLWVMLHRARLKLRRCVEFHWLGERK